MSTKNLVKATYFVKVMQDESQWLHSAGSDFLFAYLDPKTMSADTIKAVTKAFTDALQMSNKIKAAVLSTSGQTVVDGLYLLDQTAMTKAMNTIDGMGMTSANTKENSGSGSAVSISNEFFSDILTGVGGDVTPMQDYLKASMGKVIAQVATQDITTDFGIVIGLISVMPVLNVPTTTFMYAHTTSETKTWITKILCGSEEKNSYDYTYEVVNYNYVKPTIS